jgi:hypothetical protein
MCHLNFTIDRSVHTLKPVFDLLGATSFYIRSVRLAPVASSSRADVHLSLGGGSRQELALLVAGLRKLPAVLSMQHRRPAVWIGGDAFMP